MLKKHPYKREQPVLKNPMRICIICNTEYKAVAPLQKTCSLQCRKIHYAGNIKKFHHSNPEAMKEYNKNRLLKNPNAWKDKLHKERSHIIGLLGGKCCVKKCNVKNIYHLHIDYIPTMIGTGYRHPRHRAWVVENIKDFRLLCANHHYELTITGKIEGTNITQKQKKKKYGST